MSLFTRNKLSELKEICKDLDVKSLYLFGSVLGDNFKEDSDIDFIVEIDDDNPISYTEKYFILKEKLSELFDRKIDLLEADTNDNQYREMVLNTSRKRIYGS